MKSNLTPIILILVFFINFIIINSFTMKSDSKNQYNYKQTLETSRSLLQYKRYVHAKLNTQQKNNYLQRYQLLKQRNNIKEKKFNPIVKQAKLVQSINKNISKNNNQLVRTNSKQKQLKQMSNQFLNKLKLKQKHKQLNLAQSTQIKINTHSRNHTLPNNIENQSRQKSSRKKITLANKNFTYNYPIRQKSQEKWYQPIIIFFDNFKNNENGCQCIQPCKFASFTIRWSQSTRYHDSSMYRILKRKSNKQKIESQIMKDINRTQPETYFLKNEKFKNIFKNILLVYSKYDTEIQYIQGMNFILSGLLYHIKQQQKCFWVFANMMQKLQIRELFLGNFQKVNFHIRIIKQKLQKYVNDLYRYLIQKEINLEIICFPWILSILSILVNIEFIHIIFEGFIRNGWKYIYRIIITYFLYLKDEILQKCDSAQILVLLSFSEAHKNHIKWEQIIKNSQNYKIF